MPAQPLELHTVELVSNLLRLFWIVSASYVDERLVAHVRHFGKVLCVSAKLPLLLCGIDLGLDHHDIRYSLTRTEGLFQNSVYSYEEIHLTSFVVVVL